MGKLWCGTWSATFPRRILFAAVRSSSYASRRGQPFAALSSCMACCLLAPPTAMSAPSTPSCGWWRGLKTSPQGRSRPSPFPTTPPPGRARVAPTICAALTSSLVRRVRSSSLAPPPCSVTRHWRRGGGLCWSRGRRGQCTASPHTPPFRGSPQPAGRAFCTCGTLKSGGCCCCACLTASLATFSPSRPTARSSRSALQTGP
mmetsp:Transcript_50315/g.166598  ORF Transcript_50315/g.166598 Transcript_50315/m.166598 type:complete len:202 (-) Transcript_50315:1492-2097(-)